MEIWLVVIPVEDEKWKVGVQGKRRGEAVQVFSLSDAVTFKDLPLTMEEVYDNFLSNYSAFGLT